MTDEHEVKRAGQISEMKIPCEIYSRIVGYFRPVQDWHKGKKQEFGDRTMFDVQKTVR